MRTYVIIVGIIFGLITLAHVWRMFVEPRLTTDPVFLLITLTSTLLSLGAWWVSRRSPQP